LKCGRSKNGTSNIEHPTLNEAATQMQVAKTSDPLADRISDVLTNFTKWLDGYGETSHDHQSFFAGPLGRQAKSLYYRNRIVGTAAVAPMIFCEAFLPSARRLFHQRIRFPIADAHYAMGFAFLYESIGDTIYLERAIRFLDELKASRCPNFKEYCWGYPFNWVTLNGVIKKQTPLITTTPYCYEAFLQVYEILGRASDVQPPTSDLRPLTSRRGVGPPGPEAVLRPRELLDECKRILESIARHACNDNRDFKTSETASSCSYTPFDQSGGVVNAAAYRAFLLTSASRVFSNEHYWKKAERNLTFVLGAQKPDGSWPYAVDSVRDFVDHYHTCFVMKALAKIHRLTGDKAVAAALGKGVGYYLRNLFDKQALPKPFAKAPRLTVYKRELYDFAECINLCLLLSDRFPELENVLERVIRRIVEVWIKPDGSFRSRRLHLGWDNVPMHRWGQSQMFRSLAFYLCEARQRAASGFVEPTLRREQRTEDGGPIPEYLIRSK
jgi:hypothetical protein